MSDVARLPQLPERRRRPIGEERRAAILAALEDLLRERPLADISVGDIASAAGVTRSGFYFYFASKGAAVTARLGDVFGEMVAGATRFVSASGPPTESLRVALFGGWQAWREHEGLILGMLDARGSDPAIRELWDAWIERFVTALVDPLEQQRATGRAVAGPAGHELLFALLGANERTFERLSRVGADVDQAERAVEALVAVWARGIFGIYEEPGEVR